MVEAFVQAFVAPHRRDRWRTMLASAKRHRFLDRLNHCADLDPRSVQAVASSGSLLAELRSRGAPATCHVLSSIAGIDGRTMSLAEAIDAAETGGWGTILHCVPGRLAGYIDEAGTERRLVLER